MTFFPLPLQIFFSCVFLAVIAPKYNFYKYFSNIWRNNLEKYFEKYFTKIWKNISQKNRKIFRKIEHEEMTIGKK